MARAWRFIDNERGFVLLTSRTLQGRYLMAPSSTWVNALILGVLGRAQRMYDVEIYAFVFLSNHFHLLVRVNSAQQMARFAGFMKSNLARKLGVEFDWKATYWGRRYHSASLEDSDHSTEDSFRYILSNGCKENLVASPLDWPGVSSAWALSRGVWELDGIWLDGSSQSSDGRGPARVRETVQMSPLPRFKERPHDQSEFVLVAIQKLEQETRARHLRDGTRPLGAERIRRRNPHDKAKELPHARAPLFHATSGPGLKRLKEARAGKAAAYREASQRLRGGEENVKFPEDTFPPAPPFVKKRGPP